MIPWLIGACAVGYILGAAAMAFIVGAHLKRMPPLPFQLPDNLDCRACIFVETLKKQHAELCRAWAELEKR